jgi:hypothetical protein
VAAEAVAVAAGAVQVLVVDLAVAAEEATVEVAVAPHRGLRRCRDHPRARR